MKKSVIICTGAKFIGKKIARKLKAEFSELQVIKFPDNEIDVKILKNVKGKEVILIQSFYGNLNDKIVETLFAGYTAKDLGAKKLKLVATYFPYFRKDKRFSSGECVSIKVIDKMFRVFDKIFVVNPHLHRIKKIKKALKNGVKISSIPEISNYIKKLKIKDKFFIGPDIESSQWAKQAAELLDWDFSILRKIRYGSRKVKIKLPGEINIKEKNVIIIDDIISSGHTMLQAIKELRKHKPKKVYCVGIHGVFVENALKKLQKYSVVVSTNTIPSKASKIDLTNLIVKALK